MIKEDPLCPKCRNQLNRRIRKKKVDDIEVEYFYDYDGIFSSILLQYKECYDEALSEVFAYDIVDYVKIRYYGYKVCFVPSSEENYCKRGFHPMELILKSGRMEEVESVNMVNQLCQKGKSGADRKLMEHNFNYQGKMLDKVLIVDDVLTTGSTIKGMYNALKPYCTTVKVLVMAVA